MPSSLRLLSLIGLAAASPLSSIESYTQTLHARDSNAAVTASQLDSFKFYVKHASAAYCNYNATAGTPLSCVNDACPGLNATVVNSFSGLLTGIAGYVSVDDSRKEIVLSVRGSSNIRNFIDDAVFLHVPCDLAFGCLLHAGFFQAWGEISNAVNATLSAALHSRPGYPIVATGHSLGAAVATIGAAFLRRGGYPMDLYTYGSPRPGNVIFTDFVTRQPGSENRVTHFDDPVPRLPPIAVNYAHTSPEFWLAGGDSNTVDYGVDDIKVCTGYQNASCNAASLLISLDVDAHEHYFQAMDGCRSGLSLGP